MILEAFYLKEPTAAEVFFHGGGTDIILRRNIQSVKEPIQEDPETEPATVWHCEEVQVRKPGRVTLEAARADAAALWAQAAREENKDPLPTLEQRVEALEAAQLALLDMGV